MPAFLRDLRFGGRALLKSPGYALVITLTVALAIGANTIIFSFANPFLIKPMPIADQARIAFIYSVDPQRATMRGRSSYLDFLDWRGRLRSFASLAAWTDTNATLTGRGDAERLQARLVTPNLFATWGLQPVAGRLLREGDEQPGRPCIVVLSDHLWASKYQRDEMTRVEYGFDASPVLTAEIELPKWKDWSPEEEARYYVSLLTALRQSADVQAAAVTSTLPVVANGARTQFDVAGRPMAADQRPWAYEFRVSDGYFEAMGIPVLRGRAFADADRAGQEPVALVDAEAARRYRPASGDALGARISVAPPGGAAPRWMRVVGVVGNVADANLESPVAPHLYVSMLQQPAASVAIVVRTAAPERAVAAVRGAVASVDRDVALFGARTLSGRLDEELSSTRILMMLFVAFAVIALTLAASGLYAVISYLGRTAHAGNRRPDRPGRGGGGHPPARVHAGHSPRRPRRRHRTGRRRPPRPRAVQHPLQRDAVRPDHLRQRDRARAHLVGDRDCGAGMARHEARSGAVASCGVKKQRDDQIHAVRL